MRQRRGQILLATIIAVTGAVATAHAQEPDRLAPLRFLVGEWHGEGRGPNGPYRYVVRYEERGGWIEARNDITPEGASEPLLKSFAALGVDAEGRLVNHMFDAAGHVPMIGRVEGEGLTFEWRESEDAWRKFRIERKADGGLRYSADLAVPGSGVLHFESEARPEPLPVDE